MPDDESWRSQDATGYLDRVQRAGFAWEFLRRNPDYRKDYDNMSRHLASGTTIALEAALALAQRWGLSFPVRSAATEQPGADAMGIQRTPDSNRPDGGAIRSRKHVALRFFAAAGIFRRSRQRPAHALARRPQRPTDMGSSGCEADCFGCRRHSLRQGPPATARRRAPPVAASDGGCNNSDDLPADQTATPPHDLDAEGT